MNYSSRWREKGRKAKPTINITIKKQMDLIRNPQIPRIIESRKCRFKTEVYIAGAFLRTPHPASYKEYYLLAENTITQ
jgi:hypothetical protein